MRLGLLLLGCVALVACSKDPTNNATNDLGDSPTYNAVTTTTVLAVGSTECATGGNQLAVGLDNGDSGGIAGDGLLQPGEIDKTQTYCNPEGSGAGTVTRASVVAFGDDNCPFGGTLVELGEDDGDDGGTAGNQALETGEVEQRSYSCLPKPPDLLVESDPVPLGDPDCPTGGEQVRSGFDNGDDGGTSANGLLEPGEIDLNQKRCNPDATSPFTPETATTGDSTFEARGGNAAGTSTAGQGGAISLAMFSGPLPSAIELRKVGAVGVNLPTPTLTYSAGTHEVHVTASVSVPTLDTMQSSGLYLLGTIDDPVDALPLYDGATAVTSLHVDAGVTLTFEDNVDRGLISWKISGDLHNEGTVTTQNESGTDRVDLGITARHIFNDTTGVIDGRGQPLWVMAIAEAGGTIVNRGLIQSRGADASETGTVSSEDLVLLADGDIYNAVGGLVTTRGGDDVTRDLVLQGRTIYVRTLRGTLYNGGTLEARGGQNLRGGNGGHITLVNGPDIGGLESSVHPRLTRPTLLTDQNRRLPGSFANTGTLDLRGSDTLATGTGNSGSGGTLTVRIVGGTIRSAGSLLTDGGNVLGAGSGGDAGDADLLAFAFVTTNDALTVPAEIALSGTISMRGGDGKSSGRGGSGGQLFARLDAPLAGEIEDLDDNRGVARLGSAPNSNYIVYPTDPVRLAAVVQTPRIRLLGFGGVVNLSGGNTAGSATAASGGSVVQTNAVCSAPADSCAYGRVGERLSYSDVKILSAGGDSATGRSGDGGSFSSTINSAANRSSAVLGAARIDLQGTLTFYAGVPGPSSSASSVDGGRVRLVSDTGDVRIGATLDFDGPDGGTYAPMAGGLEVFGYAIELGGVLLARPGVGSGNIGRAGQTRLHGFRVSVPGVVRVGDLELAAAKSLTVAGEIDLDGQPLLNGTEGGSLYVDSPSSTITGSIHANGATSATSTGAGGSVYFERGVATLSGTLSLVGGSGPGAGDGGNMAAIGLTNTGTIACGGGDDPAGTGGDGGLVQISANSGTITGRGGDGQSGGRGGSLEIVTNSAAIDLRGGDGSTGAGGAGGTATTTTNTACIDVSGGAGSSAGQAGTVAGPNVCGS